MNIKFDDKNFLFKLEDITIHTYVIGSHLYELNDEYSDIDNLSIYSTTQNELSSIFQTHHQYQYVCDGVDKNFVSIHNFLKNTINGDSTINFELINSKSLINTPLEELYNNRHIFFNYSIIRSYLGLARRDYMHYSKQNNDRDRIKAIIHMYRGYLFSKNIYECIKSDFEVEFKLIRPEINQFKKEVESMNFSGRRSVLGSLMSDINSFRSLFNDEYNNRKNNNIKINKYIDVKDMYFVDNFIKSLMNGKNWKYSNIDLSMAYDSFENGVIY